MAWTEEQKEAQRQRMRAMNQAKRNPASNAIFAAQNRNKVDEQTGTYGNGDATVTSHSPGKVWLYKPGPYGYTPLQVVVTNLDTVLAAGYLPVCPTCDTLCQLDGKPCPSADKAPYRVCPVPTCAKTFYDQPPTTEVAANEDPNLIRDDAYLPSTPALRTKAAMDAHMAVYHPVETAAMARQNPAHLRRLEETSARA